MGVVFYPNRLAATGQNVLPRRGPRSVLQFQNAHSLAFDGLSKYVTISGNPANLNFNAKAQAFSISLWASAASLSGTLPMLVGKTGSGGLEMNIGVWPNGRVHFNLSDVGGGACAGDSPAGSFTVGAWHHVVLVNVDGTLANAKLYIDGASQTLINTSDTLSGTTANGGNWQFGTDVDVDAGFMWPGLMDEVSFWNVALSGAQVTALYNGGTPTNLAGQAGALAWYRFESTGLAPADTPTTIYDRIGSNDATGTGLVSGDFSTSLP